MSEPMFDPEPEDVYDPDLAERLVELEAETRTDA